MKRTNKVIIFDCQLLQTKAWHRGMGKYTAQTLSAFLGNKKYVSGYEKIVLLFNSKLAYADDLRTFVNKQKNIETVFVALETPQEGDQHSITINQRKNKATLDAYIQENYEGKDVGFMITSLFLDEACPAFPSSTYNSLIYYDLIPLMYYRLYLGLGASEQYFTRFSVLLEADQIFAISETVANDMVSFLGVPREKIVNIRGASNPMDIKKIAKPDLAITKPYVLMPTGGDPRKNNLNGVKGFSKFNAQNGNRYQLLVTSFFTDEQKDELRKYTPDVLFTGNVSDAEVGWLYRHAEAVLFPAEYEGLGMPILEAIDADRSIVCSNIAVFREISPDAFFMFDPMDPSSIAASLEEAFTVSERELKAKKKHYKTIGDYYTWDATASIINERLLQPRHRTTANRPRIAIVTPNLCQSNMEGRYMAQLFPSLRDHYDIDFYYDMSGGSLPIRPSYLAFAVDIQPVYKLTQEKYSEYDLVVYVISNSQASVATLLAALAMPGLVITADANLVNVYDAALAEGVMTRGRFEKESGDYLESVRRRSRAVITTVPDEPNSLGVIAAELAYPPAKGRGLANRIFVPVDIDQKGVEWNIDFVRDIALTVDKSRVDIVAVSRTRFPKSVYQHLDLPSVTLYEDTSDHEYLTLLAGSDAYIDARPGGALDKLFPAFEAYRNGLDVFVGPISGDKDGRAAKGIYVSPTKEMLIDKIYHWLLGDIDGMDMSKVTLPIKSVPTDLVKKIDELLAQKKKEEE